MWGSLTGHDELMTTLHQFVTTRRPFSHATPSGVCIQLFAAMIHVDESTVPSATMHVAKKCSFGPTRPSPKSMIPRNPASRKNEVSTSRAINGPMTDPAIWENREKVSPNSNDSTIPVTTPIAKLIAKMFSQNL